MSTASADDPSSEHTADAARRAWANNLRNEWDRRSASEEYHHSHLHPELHGLPQPQLTPTSSYRYRPASAETIAQAEAVATARRAEEIRRYHEHQEEIKYRERQAARAAREVREAAAARKAFEEERKRLEEERRKREEERQRNEEQMVVAAWRRYEQGWQDLTSGVNTEVRPLTFYDIPWPVSMPARSFEELQPAAIEKFLLHPCHSKTKTRKMRLRAALKQWHIDKFTQRFEGRLEETHRPAVLAAANIVTRAIIRLMYSETEADPTERTFINNGNFSYIKSSEFGRGQAAGPEYSVYADPTLPSGPNLEHERNERRWWHRFTA